MDNRISMCLPCRISVYVEGGRTVAAVMRPTALGSFFPDAAARLGGVLKEIDGIVMAIVNEACDG